MLKKTAKKTDRFMHGELLGKLRVLQLNAKALSKLRRIRIPSHAEHFHISRIRIRESFTNFYGRRLPRPVWPKQTETFPRMNFQVQFIDGNHVFVCFSEMADAESGLEVAAKHGLSIASDGRTFKAGFESNAVARLGWVNHKFMVPPLLPLENTFLSEIAPSKP